MGMLFSRLLSGFKKDSRILLLGLDAAGKTTILYRLKLGEVISSIPTIGFNVETVEYKHVSFTVWDVGGQDKIRRLWRHYYRGTNALVYVVDASDKGRFETARDELNGILEADEMKDASVLVLANKQDLPGAASASEVADAMGLHKMRGREWYIQGCCATTGDGLWEGFDWLVDTVNKKA